MLLSEFIEYLNFSKSLKATINQNVNIFSVCLLPDEEEQAFQEDVIYLTTDCGRTEKLVKSAEPKTILCLCGNKHIRKVSERKISAQTNVIFADPSDMTDLFLMRSKLTEYVFSDLNEDVKNLEDLIVGGSLEELLTTGYKYLGHHFMVIDSGQNVLCSTFMEPDLETEIRKIVLDQQPLAEQKETEHFNSEDRATHILCCQSDQTGEELLISQFTTDGRVIGHLIVNYEKELVTIRDYNKTSVMSSLVCKLLLSMNRVRNPVNSFDTLFIRILEGNITEKRAAEESAKLKWMVPKKMRALVACTDEIRNYRGILQPAFDELLSHLKNGRGTIYSNRIVIFTEDDIDREEIRKILAENKLRGGISQTFFSLQNGRVYYKQAEETRKMAAELSFSGSLHRFEDLSVYFMLRGMKEKEVLRQLINPGLFKLLDSDRETGADLFKTFACYVECLGNLNTVSEKMFVHRNTIKYRISKIEEILEENLKDPERYSVFLLSFQIIDYLRRTGQWDPKL